MATSSVKPQEKQPKVIEIINLDQCVGCQLCMYACSRRFGDAGLAHTAMMVQSAYDFERGFIVTVCRGCEDPPCASVCPTNALISRKGIGVTLKPQLCIGCKNCVNACTLNAVFWDVGKNKPIICVYCGNCAEICPHGVIELQEKGRKYNVT
jgi:carbon-monoxide dehydrogenase iron sulfur subunit